MHRLGYEPLMARVIDSKFIVYYSAFEIFGFCLPVVLKMLLEQSPDCWIVLAP